MNTDKNIISPISVKTIPISYLIFFLFSIFIWYILPQIIYYFYEYSYLYQLLVNLEIWGYIIISTICIVIIIFKYEIIITSKFNNIRTLFDTTNVGHTLCRMDGTFVIVNFSYTQITGYTKEELLNLSYWDFTPKKYIKDEKLQLKSLSQNGNYSPYIKEYIHKDGHLVPVKLSGSIFEYKKVKYIWSNIEDITDQQLQENKKHAQKRRVSRFNEALNKFIKHPSIVTGNFIGLIENYAKHISQVMKVNRVSVWLFNKNDDYSTIDCVNLWVNDENTHIKNLQLSSKDFPKYFEALETDRTLKFDDVYNEPIVQEFTDIYFPEHNITSMLDAPFFFAGEIAGVLCLEHTEDARQWGLEEESFLISVTDIISIAYEALRRIELETNLRHSEKLEALSKLSGGIAHDFNNIFGVILGYTELLSHSLIENNKLTDYVNEISHAGKRATRLTNKLLSFSNKKIPDPIPLDINETIENIRSNLANSISSLIHLEISLDNSLTIVKLDQNDLIESINNIISNANNAIRGIGKISISTYNTNLSHQESLLLNLKKGRYATISIKDTGIGFSDEIKHRIFEPFYTTKGVDNLGLGLCQVYGFVNKSDGTVLIQSKLKKGTEVKLLFPENNKDIFDSITNNDMQIDNSSNYTILLVDDEKAMLKLTNNLLKKTGFKVIYTLSSKKALEILHQKPIDLMISDVIMPEIDGFELAHIARQQFPKLKVQLISGFNDIDENSYFNKNLHDNILHKPFDSKALINKISRLLDI